MYVAVRDFTVRWIGYKDVFTGLKDLDLGGFELYVGKDMKGGRYVDMGEAVSLGFDMSTEPERRALMELLESQDLQVCTILVENDFGKDDIDAEVTYVVCACKVASSLGVDTVRINSVMRPKPDITEEEYIQRTAQCARKILKNTEGLEVSLAMENHGVLGNKHEFIQAVLEAVGSERMGLTLDTGNFYWYGYPLQEVYKIIRDFTPYVKHTHLKNVSYPKKRRDVKRKPGEGWPKVAAPLYKGDINLQHVVNMLKQAGYDKDLTIEDESLGNFTREQRAEILRKDIEFVKRLI